MRKLKATIISSCKKPNKAQINSLNSAWTLYLSHPSREKSSVIINIYTALFVLYWFIGWILLKSPPVMVPIGGTECMSHWGWGLTRPRGGTVDMITVNSTVALDLYPFNNLALGLFDFTDALYWGEKKFTHNLQCKKIGIFNQLQWSLLYSFLVFLCLYHLVNTFVIELSDL